MKGFAITLDATVAISVIMFAMIIIASQSHNPRAPEGVYLKQLTMDTVTVLQKTGRLDYAIEGNTTLMQDVIEATPNLACIEITIIDDKGYVITNAIKNDCNETFGLDVQTTASPIIYENSRYIIKSESWLRKEP
ncbi:MAG: hypothetical protein ABH842_04220 [Candidatus Micrarchaeota archaeon]